MTVFRFLLYVDQWCSLPVCLALQWWYSLSWIALLISLSSQGRSRPLTILSTRGVCRFKTFRKQSLNNYQHPFTSCCANTPSHETALRSFWKVSWQHLLKFLDTIFLGFVLWQLIFLTMATTSWSLRDEPRTTDDFTFPAWVEAIISIKVLVSDVTRVGSLICCLKP